MSLIRSPVSRPSRPIQLTWPINPPAVAVVVVVPGPAPSRPVPSRRPRRHPPNVYSFVMVFACLMLSVFATIDAYEQTASVVLFYMVSRLC